MHTRTHFHYGVYGISLRSEFPLSLPGLLQAALIEIELCTGSPAVFSNAVGDTELQSRSDWYHYACLEDGSSYVRWSGLGEFLVASDGRHITCRRAPEALLESFQVYLLGQALSFALVKSGFEPLHATAVAVGGEAIAFLGESGFGKSSLAACFLAAGHSLLTDDLLLIRPGASGFEAYPGPARIKLIPDVAHYFLGDAATGVPMNPETNKLVIPLDQRQSCSTPLHLAAIYALAPPHETSQTQHVLIEVLSLREAFLAMVGNTFNYLVVDPDRLQRQVGETTRLVKAVQVKKLYYPRGLSQLPELREAILSDVNRSRCAEGQGKIQ